MDTSSSPAREVVVTFSPPVEEERELLARAEERGTDVAAYPRAPVEEDLRRLPRLSEVLAPVHEDFRRSGMTEDELEALIEEARDERWREKRRGGAAS